MSIVELKTKPTQMNVSDFIESIQDNVQKADSKKIVAIMQEASGEKPKMWGTSIVGFLNIHLKYASGRELDWFKIGFSPRKNALTIYGLNIYNDKIVVLLRKLGKYKKGKGCLYMKTLADIDLTVLKQLIEVIVKDIS